VLSLSNFPRYKPFPLKWLVCLSAALLLIILAAGLKPRGSRLENRVSWIKDQPGLRFRRFGIAYTNPLDGRIASGKSDADGFSVEMALRPASYRDRRFKVILALHNGADRDQLIMGQWRSWLIVMNGDDYAYKEKTNRISADAASSAAATRFVTITSGQQGTEIFLDGRLAGTKKDLRLRIPAGAKTRLLVGNSVYGKHPWRGDIYGLALYRHTLTLREAALHFNRWSKDRSLSFAGDDHPFALYLFDEKEGTRALDHSGANLNLEIPSRMQVLETRILAPPWNNFNFNRGFIMDAIINLIGFIPFAFILSAILVGAGGALEKRAVLITVAFCFLVSLTLEILQAWMPSRSSSLLDLMLNTIGGWTGAFIYRFFSRPAWGKESRM
jgi:hypothetical protein